MSSSADKVRENRLRRAAKRQGMALTKVRRIDPRAVDYGHCLLMRDGEQILDTASLDDVERVLAGEQL